MRILEEPVEEYVLDPKKVEEAHQMVWELVQYIASENQRRNNIKQHCDAIGKNILIITD